MESRVRALQSVLTQKYYIDPAALDVLIDTYQTQVGPRNGARVVARSWVDPQFRDWLLRDASKAWGQVSILFVLDFKSNSINDLQ